MRKLLPLLFLLPCLSWAAEHIGSVEAGTDSVILRFPLYDAAAPESCATDVTSSTTGLEINVSTDVSDGYADTFTQSAGTLEAITTIGTYATPTANHARFEIIASGSCWYELQLPDAVFDVANASQVNIEITDGGTEILDANYWVDMTPVSQDSLLSAIGAYDCSTDSTDDTLGYQICAVLDSILTDTGTTLDTKLTSVQSTVGYYLITSGTADSGSATTLADSDLDQGDDYFNNYSALVVEFTSGPEVRCVRDFTASSDTLTVFPAFTQAVSTENYALVIAPECRTFP